MRKVSQTALHLAALTLLLPIHAVRGNTILQQAYLKASNTGANDGLGIAVAVSGDTMVVGAPFEDSNATGVNGDQTNNSAPDSGAAYVFVRNGTNWTQQAYLKASNTGAGDYFGYSVSVSGDTVVVGAWRESSDATGVNGDGSNDRAPRSGAAYVFVQNGTTWTQQAYLKASNTGGAAPGEVQGDYFGFSVAVSGDTVLVGATGEDSSASGVDGDQGDDSASFAGAAYVFVRNGTTWTQQAYLKASNTEAYASFGESVAVAGDTVAVGSGEGGGVKFSGAAYVFVRNGTTWSEEARLKASNPVEGAFFGSSVAVSGDTVVVGTGWENSNATGVNGDQSDTSASESGAAYVFVRSGTTWGEEAYLKAFNTGPHDHFGQSVAVSGDTVVVGAYHESSNATGVNGDQNDNSATNSGAAYVFVRSGTNWSQQAYLKASNTGAGDCFGASVAVSGNTVMVGAGSPFTGGEDSNATGVNGDQANNSAKDSGATYIFTTLGLEPRLAIALSAQSAILSWPVGATNYFLEATTSLPAISWTTVTNTPIITATNRSVQLPLIGPTQFFRLRKP